MLDFAALAGIATYENLLNFPADIDPSRRVDVVNVRGSGYFRALRVQVNNSGVEVVWELDGREIFRSTLSNMDDHGLDNAHTGGLPYLEDFDSANSSFTIAFAPTLPIYFRSTRVTLVAPDATVTIGRVEGLVARLSDSQRLLQVLSNGAKIEING